MSVDKPVLLGGSPLLTETPPLARPPLLREHGDLLAVFGEIVAGGTLTKGGHLAALEAELAEFLGVAHTVAVSSCTSGLMLLMRVLGAGGEVVMPSFTFMASAHAARWNGLRPVFADIDPGGFGLSAAAAAQATGDRTVAILGVHVFGTPCDADALAEVAAARGVPLLLDAAPAFGAVYPDGTRVGGKGLAEVFSLSPTKPFTAGEGGIVTTSDESLARELRIAREYGNPGSFDSLFVGLNARMPELSAALARHQLPGFPDLLARRLALVQRYRAALADVPGIEFPRVPPGATSTHKDLSLTVDPALFGIERDTLVVALRAENVPTRNYFDPPVHRQTAYREAVSGPLPNTEARASAVFAVPLYSGMTDDVVDRICAVIRRVQAHADSVAQAVRPTPQMRSVEHV
ncbi:DegT/DnrJ/EryC1/StrS family aminotransferase [Micromonospora sp. RTGN7]|uniref:DegT/DnrJ/EryC1/StrS family aminotransferase n=1 Tax=Micromonospora sp. RTGN7 TaxID=3016526 RepID=UPI0029FEF422|nr:DegT/DnrJ/EryC1/StrS family aminotransferase [Micromonospora sp. RTGN7]